MNRDMHNSYNAAFYSFAPTICILLFFFGCGLVPSAPTVPSPMCLKGTDCNRNQLCVAGTCVSKGPTSSAELNESIKDSGHKPEEAIRVEITFEENTIEKRVVETTIKEETQEKPPCSCTNKDFVCISGICKRKDCNAHDECAGICQFDPDKQKKKCFPCLDNQDCKSFTPQRPYCNKNNECVSNP